MTVLREPYGGARDQTRVCCMRGKCPPRCPIAPAPGFQVLWRWEPGYCLACLSLSTTARLGFDPQNPMTLPSITRSDSGSPLDPYNGGLGHLRARIAPSYPAQALEPPAYWQCVSWSDPQLHRHTRALLRRPKPKSKYLYVLWGARSTAVSKTAA